MEELELGNFGNYVGLSDESSGGIWETIQGLASEIVNTTGYVFEFNKYKEQGYSTQQALAFMVDRYGGEICSKLTSVISAEDCANAKKIVAQTVANNTAQAVAVAAQTEAELLAEQQRVEIERMNNVLDKFGRMACKNLTYEQKQELSEKLSEVEQECIRLGMEDRFKELLSKFACPLEKTECSATETVSVPQMQVGTTTVPATEAPLCNYEPKPSILKTWGIPVATGGATGTITYIATNKIVVALPAAILGFGVAKYLVSKKGA
jgi:hypothetical protein